MIIYKGLSKTEFAQDAGIPMPKLRKWIKESAKELAECKLNPQDKILPPLAVKKLAEKYQVFPHNAQIV